MMMTEYNYNRIESILFDNFLLHISAACFSFIGQPHLMEFLEDEIDEKEEEEQENNEEEEIGDEDE